jgi:hypothetical protein
MSESPRQRSPNYPNLSLPDAITRVRRVFDADRRNPIERAVAAKHMGYSGLSGAADKTIGSIMQYGLLERVGKGELRVSQLAMDIFHPDKPDDRRRAIGAAGVAPPVFRALRERYPDTLAPSPDSIRSYLVRQNFLDHAIPQVISAFTETCQFLQLENAIESDGALSETAEESLAKDDGNERDQSRTPPPPPPPAERKKMDGQRTLTSGILSTEANFEVLVTGPVGVKEIERLIRKLEIDKEILADKSDETDVSDLH